MDLSARCPEPRKRRIAPDNSGRVLVWVLAVLALVCGALAVAWWMAPEQLRLQVERRGTQALGRAVTLQQVQLSLRPLGVTLQGLSVGPAAGAVAGAGAAPVGPTAPPLLQVQRLAVELDAWSLWRGEPVITRLEVDDPRLQVARSAAGAWSLDDLRQRLQPRADATSSPGTGPVFTVQNVSLKGGRWNLDDQLLQQRHEVAELRLDVPWFSTRAEDAGREVQARLSLRLNGAALNLQAQALPMRPQPSVQARLQVTDLGLAPWWPWLPADLPLQPRGGQLDADLTLAAAQEAGGPWSLALSGTTAVQSLQWVNAAGAPMASWDRLEVGLKEVRPLQQFVQLSEVRLQGAQVHVRRDARGQLEWASSPTSTTSTTLPKAAAPAAGGSPGWKLQAGPVAVEGLQVHWTDQLPRPAVRAGISGLDLHVDQIAWPVQAPSAFQLKARVHPPALGAARSPQPVDIDVSGSASDQSAQLSWRVGALALAPWQPYVATVVRPLLQGTARANGQLDWSAVGQPRLRAAVRSLQVDDFQAQLRATAQPPVAWKSLVVEGLRADLLSRQLGVEQIVWREPAVHLRRGRDGGVGLEGVPSWDGLLSAAAIKPAPASTAASSWSGPKTLTASTATSATSATPAPRASVDSGASEATAGEGTKAAQAAQASKGTTRATAAKVATEGAIKGAAPDWRVELARLRVSGARLEAIDDLVPSDVQPGAPWTLTLRPVVLELDRLAWPPGPASAGVRLALQWPQAGVGGADATPAAEAKLAGSLRLDTPGFKGTVQLERWPLQRFSPQLKHLGLELPVRVTRAELGLDSRFDLSLGARGLETAGEGSIRVADVLVLAPREAAAAAVARNAESGAPAAATPAEQAAAPTATATAVPPATAAAVPTAALTAEAAADELARWNLLQVQGLRWQVAPGQQPRLDVGLVRLSDFFARLQVTEAGRLNLQDVTAPRPDAGPAAATPAKPAGPASVASATAAPTTAGGPGATAAASPAAGTELSGAASRWPLELSVERTELVNGRVDFIDRFIRPNYAADLTELNGFLGRFESGSARMAPVELRGRAARTALLEIRGAVNPIASPLMLDLSARATDLELAPLSPYGGKYVGYTIERGKLSVDLSYRIEADGRLEARNQIILNQLTFGERINSPQATSLPVRLALALLADRNGVIDVNLPISGSINEPKFSFMGLVWKMIGNLLVKVVTAPFAWLAGGDTRDLSLVGFEPGAARLETEAAQTLDRVFQALVDRPSLRMTITGAADPAAEAQALRVAALNERLGALLRRESARAGVLPPAAPTLAALPARDSAAYASLVQRLYDETPLPDKPRSLPLVGARPPLPQMEAMLLAAVPVNENAARELALQRALAVRDALIGRGLAAERLFLAAPQVGAGPDGATKPQARMTITGP